MHFEGCVHFRCICLIFCPYRVRQYNLMQRTSILYHIVQSKSAINCLSSKTLERKLYTLWRLCWVWETAIGFICIKWSIQTYNISTNAKNHYTPEARRLARIGSRSQANPWDWGNVQVVCIFSLMYIMSRIYSFILIIIDKIFSFATSLAKTKSLMNKKMKMAKDKL